MRCERVRVLPTSAARLVRPRERQVREVGGDEVGHAVAGGFAGGSGRRVSRALLRREGTNVARPGGNECADARRLVG